MPAGKCVFNSQWLTHSLYKNWVRPFKGDKHKVNCVWCYKAIDLGNMGEGALKSHLKSAKHKKMSGKGTVTETDLSLFNFVKNERRSETESACDDMQASCSLNDGENAAAENNGNDIDKNQLQIPPPPSPKQAYTTGTSNTQQIKTFLEKFDVLKAEIIWTLRTVIFHQSFKSNEKIGETFKMMFPDSTIANNFTCADKKTAYIAVFGLCEHFQRMLKQNISGPYVILFDESLNKAMQEKQMDLHIRYWDTQLNKIVTRYFVSEFLGMFN